MKKTLLTLTAILSLCSARAEEKQFGATFTSIVANKYLFPGTGLVVYDKPVVQSDLYITLPAGFYADLWCSSSMDSRWNNNFGDEIDYGIGWAGTIGPIDVDVGVTYFDEPNIFTFGADDCFYSHIKLSRTVCTNVDVFIGWNNYVTTKKTDYEGGNSIEGGAEFSHDFFRDRLTLSASVRLIYDDGIFGFNSGFLLGGRIESMWKLTKKLSLILPRVDWFIPLTVDDEREADAMVSAGLSYTF